MSEEKRIFKYELALIEIYEIAMPENAKIIKIKWQESLFGKGPMMIVTGSPQDFYDDRKNFHLLFERR